jgi:hypothetical protein
VNKTESCMRLLPLPTERDELVELHGLQAATSSLPACSMLEVPLDTREEEVVGTAPACMCASVGALRHPRLAGTARQCRGLGYQFAVDTSLRAEPAQSGAPRAARELLAHMRTIGAYFSPTRRVVGIAEDSAWHEAVHEMVHLKFDARGSATSTPGPTAAAGNDPLRHHWQQLRARGYGARVAEEMVCREHELHALRTSGAPLWRWGVRALLVWDSGLVEAQRDLAATPTEQRTAAHAAEWRRVRMLRSFVTGPTARAVGVVAVAVAAAALASAAVRACRSIRPARGSGPQQQPA